MVAPAPLRAHPPGDGLPEQRPRRRRFHLPRRPPDARPLAALGSGLVLAAAFPPSDLWWLAPVGVAGLTLSVRHVPWRRAARLGALAGLALFTVLVAWLRVIGVDAWLALAALEALFFAPLGAALALVQRLPWWPVWTACAWVGEEALRDRIPFGGFPWGRLAFSQPDTPATPWAAVGGAPLVTAVVALVGGLLAAAAVAALRREIRPLVVPVAAGALAVVTGFALPTPTAGQSEGGRPEAVVALVQGNVPRLGLDFLGQRRAVLRNHVAATEELAASVARGEVPAPDVVLWPENASDLDPFRDQEARALVDGAVRTAGVPVLVGALLDSPKDPTRYVENAGVVWDPVTGPGDHYVKRHPVPFGEYLPFRGIVTKLVGRASLVARDFVKGDRDHLLDLGPVRLGDVICFEIAYDGIVRDAVLDGGRVIVVQTNNATYGRKGETEQQLAMSRLRAVEHGRTVLVVATSGISAVIRPDGSVAEQTDEFVRDSLVSRVPLRDDRTLATRLGAWPELALALLAVAALAVVVRRRRPV